MTLKATVKKLVESQAFKDWFSEHKDAFLAYAFIMLDTAGKGDWQMGYYLPKNGRMTTFTLKEEIEIEPNQEVFKTPQGTVKALVLDEVKMEFGAAIAQAQQVQEKEYPDERIANKIAVLQNIELGQLWNVTFVTNSFKTVNVKIDAKSGETVKHDLVALFEFSS